MGFSDVLIQGAEGLPCGQNCWEVLEVDCFSKNILLEFPSLHSIVAMQDSIFCYVSLKNIIGFLVVQQGLT
jgi:hypothetical protein